MTPQTMAVITRTFPPERRGRAMACGARRPASPPWSARCSAASWWTRLGWEWIFFINVPVGIVGFVLACASGPAAGDPRHQFDLLGVVLSAVGMFLIVFGIQEGEKYDWGTIDGWISVWSLIISGLVVLGVFVWWQAHNRGEPLVPLSLFRDRNFSVANVGIATVGFAVTAMAFPLMLCAQTVARARRPPSRRCCSSRWPWSPASWRRSSAS